MTAETAAQVRALIARSLLVFQAAAVSGDSSRVDVAATRLDQQLDRLVRAAQREALQHDLSARTEP